MIKFGFGKLDTNYHGTQKHGEPWNKQTIRGPKFTFVKLEGFDKNSKLRAGIGYRIYYYFPSGASWNFDAYRSEP